MMMMIKNKRIIQHVFKIKQVQKIEQVDRDIMNILVPESLTNLTIMEEAVIAITFCLDLHLT